MWTSARSGNVRRDRTCAPGTWRIGWTGSGRLQIVPAALPVNTASRSCTLVSLSQPDVALAI